MNVHDYGEPIAEPRLARRDAAFHFAIIDLVNLFFGVGAPESWRSRENRPSVSLQRRASENFEEGSGSRFGDNVPKNRLRAASIE